MSLGEQLVRIGIGPARLGEGHETFGEGTHRVHQQGTEVSGVDLAPRIGRGGFDDDATGGDLVGGREAGQPAVTQAADAAELAGGAAAHPHLERVLHGLGPDGDAGRPVPTPLVVHVVLGPEPPQQREGLVEHRGAVGALDAEGLMLDWVDGAEADRRKEATAGQRVE